MLDKYTRPTLFMPTALILALTAILSIAEQPSRKTTTPVMAETARAATGRPAPQAEWLEPNHLAPNGTRYRTFFSKVLERDVRFKYESSCPRL